MEPTKIVNIESMPYEDDISINIPHSTKIVNKFPAFSVIIDTVENHSTPVKAKPDFTQSCIMSDKKNELSIPEIAPIPLHSSKSVDPFKRKSHWKKIKNGFRAIAAFSKIECKKLLTGVSY